MLNQSAKTLIWILLEDLIQILNHCRHLSVIANTPVFDRTLMRLGGSLFLSKARTTTDIAMSLKSQDTLFMMLYLKYEIYVKRTEFQLQQ